MVILLNLFIQVCIIIYLLFKNILLLENKIKRESRNIFIEKLFSFNFSIIPKRKGYKAVLLFIISSSRNTYKRKRIKNTWIKLCLKISCNYYFVIATKVCLNIIKNENRNDIIGLDIVDSYYNLTVFTANIFKYYIHYNLYADYIVKIDDDIYPNIPLLFLYISLYMNKSKISGYFYKKMKVSRSINSTVYLPEHIYSHKFFPNFVAGGFVIIHSQLINDIYIELLNEDKTIYREDMHMAVIYSHLNFTFQKLNYYYHRKQKLITYKNKLNDICWHGF